MIGNGTNPQGESWLFVQVEGTANNVQCLVGIAKERDFLTVLFVLLRPSMDVDGQDVGQGSVGDVKDGDFPIKKELKVLGNESFKGLQGPSRDAFVVGFGGLAPFQGTKPGVLPQGNPIKNDDMGVKEW